MTAGEDRIRSPKLVTRPLVSGPRRPGWVVRALAEDSRVKELNVTAFFELGRSIEVFTSASYGGEDGRDDRRLVLAYNVLAEVEESISSICPMSSGPLEALLVAADKAMTRGSEGRQNPLTGKTLIDELTERFEHVFRTEAPRLPAFLVEHFGTHSSLLLLSEGELFIAAREPREKLSKEGVYHLQQAGKCLALDAFTAFGFHLCGAMETVLRDFQVAVNAKETPEKPWGARIQAIQDILMAGVDPNPEKRTQDEAKSAKLVSDLWRIKKDYRDPIMHLSMALSSEQASLLLADSLSLMIRMLERLPKPTN